MCSPRISAHAAIFLCAFFKAGKNIAEHSINDQAKPFLISIDNFLVKETSKNPFSAQLGTEMINQAAEPLDRRGIDGQRIRDKPGSPGKRLFHSGKIKILFA
jgi:hypothetical protein